MLKINRKWKKIVSVVLVLSVVLGASYFTSFAADDDNHPTAIQGQSGEILEDIVLGISDRIIANADDLLALSKLVNEGSDVSDSIFYLTVDINIAEIANWKPIGTMAHPFTGTFDGRNHTVSGLGTATHSTLFGQIRGGELRNINISLAPTADSTSPNAGLFVKAINTTITNCHVTFGATTRRISRVSLTPDYDWFIGHYSDSSYTLTNAAEVLALAEITATGCIVDASGVLQPVVSPADLGFINKTINFSGAINLSAMGTEWEGIGTADSPFRGTAKNGTFTELTMQNPSALSLGLFAHAENATLDNITIVDASIIGGSATGALVGTISGGTITNCATSGRVQGSANVGGLAGIAQRYTDPTWVYPDNTIAIEWSYSTADVLGSVSVGGLVGQLTGVYDASAATGSYIQNCFTMGNVSGSLNVGGIVGKLLGTGWFSEGPDVMQSASSGIIRAVSYAGGIVGIGVTAGTDISDCYTTSTIYSFVNTGTIAGGGVEGQYCYSSGHVVTPVVGSISGGGVDYMSINAGVGEGTAAITNYYGEPNGIYATQNDMNHLDITGYNAFRRSNPDFSTILFFDQGNTTTNVGSSAFRNATLTYSGTDSNRDVYASAGSFPALDSFVTKGGVFKLFSDLTTNTANRNMPRLLKVQGGKAVNVVGTNVSLPTVAGSSWEINGETGPYIIEDLTVNGGINTIQVNSDGTISVDHPFIAETEISFTSSITGFSGLTLKYDVVFRDEGIRPDLSPDANFPAPLHNTEAEAMDPTNAKMARGNNYLFLRFTEPLVTIGGGTTGNPFITEYSDENFTLPSTAKSGATYEIINDTILKVTLPPGFIEYGKSYKIQFTGPDISSLPIVIENPNNIMDVVGNRWNKEYYFSTPPNQPPDLYFDATHALAEAPSVINGDEQIVYMIEDDSRFIELHDGILVRDEQILDPRTAAVLTHTALASLQNQAGYPALDLSPTSPNINFFLIPGEYEFTFQMQDQETPPLPSNILTRKYRVQGEVRVFQGGSPYQPFTASFDSDDVQALLATVSSQGITVQQALEQELAKRYLNTPGPDQLTASRYIYTGLSESKAITFNTPPITSTDLTNGLETIMTFDVEDGERVTFGLSLASGLADKEIILTNPHYIVASDDYSKSNAKKYFGAKVVRRTTREELSEALFYDFSKVDPSRYNQPQEVIITTINPKGNELVYDDNLMYSKGTVTIEKKLRWKHPEEAWFDANVNSQKFWEGKMDIIRKSAADRALPMDVPMYEAANTPADFFRLVNNQDNMSANITLPNGYQLSAKTSAIDSSLMTDQRHFYDLVVEDMFSLAVERDAKGTPIFMFRTLDMFEVPGTITLRVPIEESFVYSDGMTLYTIDDETGEYIEVRTLSKDDFTDKYLTLELSSFDGKYVFTTAKLAGQFSSLID